MNGSIETDLDLYDSERVELARLVNWLNQTNVGKERGVQKYAEELVERFFKAGFHVEVRMYALEEVDTEQVVRWDPQILIEDRVTAEDEFDHDRMRYEVRSDLLGINDEGDVLTRVVGQAGYRKDKSGLIVPGGGPV